MTPFYLFLIFLSIIAIFLILFFILGFIFLFFEIFWLFKTQVPFGKSNMRIVKEFLDKLDLKGKIFVDLGSGDGSIIFEAVKRGAKGIGYEINPFLYYLSLIRGRILGCKNFYFYKQDFRKADLKNADYIYLYLTPEILNNVSEFVFNNCKENSKIITFSFKFRNKEPIEIFKNKIFVYKK
jgi:SAM-dependent methyltransferase